MARLDPEKREMMVNLVTGFKIEITDIRFKEKMSQNRDIKVRENIINELETKNTSMSRKVSKIMRDKTEL
jgi:predicted FMN-binding regulatory protein PaiB